MSRKHSFLCHRNNVCFLLSVFRSNGPWSQPIPRHPPTEESTDQQLPVNYRLPCFISRPLLLSVDCLLICPPGRLWNSRRKMGCPLGKMGCLGKLLYLSLYKLKCPVCKLGCPVWNLECPVWKLGCPVRKLECPHPSREIAAASSESG